MFDLQADALDPQACGGSGCWTNHLRVTDIDGDGDLDILLANYPDFFGGGNSPQPLVVYENDGSASFINASGTALGNYQGNLRQVAVGDVNGDGAPDIYGPDGAGGAHVLFINDGSGVFTDEADTRLPASYPAGAAARMADVDGDGDLDIFSSDGYAGGGAGFGRLYLNDGTGMFTEAMGAIPGSISGSDINDVEFFDADRDFDLDLIVNAHTGGTGALWLNDGSGVFTAGGSVDPPATGNFHYNVAPCDVDGDGDLDLWIDNIGGGFTEQLLINDGSANFSDETGARVSGNPGADDNGVVCADIDGDGDFDGVVISLAGPERFLENDGSGNFTYVAGAFPPPGDCSLWGEFGDLDDDGRLDFVTGQGECTSSDEVYLGNMQIEPDSIAPLIIAVEELVSAPAGTEPVVRYAVSDNTVTDEGPRLDRAFAVIDPNGVGTIVDAVFMGGDLFRVVLPAADAGPVTFQVCAEDRNANIGCSEDQIYEIGDGPPPGTTGDSGDDADSSGDNGSADTDSGTGNSNSASASASMTSAGSSGTETETAGAGDDGGGGCNCRQGSGEGPRGIVAFGLLGLLGLGARRRRS